MGSNRPNRAKWDQTGPNSATQGQTVLTGPPMAK